MQISRITKINVEYFVNDMNLYDPSNFVNNCESVEYYQIFDEDKIYLGFAINDLENNKNINIIFVRENITEFELINCIKYIKTSINYKNKLCLTV